MRTPPARGVKASREIEHSIDGLSWRHGPDETRSQRAAGHQFHRDDGRRYFFTTEDVDGAGCARGRELAFAQEARLIVGTGKTAIQNFQRDPP